MAGKSNGRHTHWEFTSDGASWSWRCLDADGTIVVVSQAPADFGRAMSDAISRGFDPAVHHWLVRGRESVTQYSPGKPAVTTLSSNPSSPRT